MAQAITLTFQSDLFGAPRENLEVSLYLRAGADSFFVDESTFKTMKMQSRKTVGGEATFEAYSSPDLASEGFLDAYWILDIPAIGLKRAFWIPAADTPEFADGDLSVLIELEAPIGDVLPPGQTLYYFRSETYSRPEIDAEFDAADAALLSEATAREQGDEALGAALNEAIAGLGDAAAAGIGVPNGVASLDENGKVSVSQLPGSAIAIAISGDRAILENELRALIVLRAVDGAPPLSVTPLISLPAASFYLKIQNSVGIDISIQASGGTPIIVPDGALRTFYRTA